MCMRALSERADLHMALGMALQSEDIQHHTGGTLQPEALAAYETAYRQAFDPTRILLLFKKVLGSSL